MPTTLNTVREFVIDSLKKYHGILASATENSLTTTLSDFVSKEYAASTYLTKADAASTYITYQYAAATYVAKDGAKVLSTNDFTDAYKTKLDGIAENAEVNVNADWSAASGDAQILNKPNIEALFGYAYYDSTNHRISFSYSSSSSELYNINCSDFIVDGMIDSVSIEDYTGEDITNYGASYLYIDFNTDAEGTNHTDIKIPLQDIFAPNNYYTKSEIDSEFTSYNTRVTTLETAYTYFTSAYSYTQGRINDFQQAYTYLSSAYTYLSNELLDDESTWAAALVDLNGKIDGINNYGYITNVALTDYPTYTNANTYYVHQEAGKGLSTNDFTDAYESKLDGIATGAQVNTIESITVNGGSALPIDANKNVDITVSQAQLSLGNNSKSADANGYTYVINDIAVNDHQITVTYTGVLTQHQDISGKEDTTNKKTNLTVATNISDTFYPSTSAVASYVGSLAELTPQELNTIFGITTPDPEEP